ncbi:hypothetical protein [Diaphorobacter sp. JS3051]|uniref:hypothetical protein n=1 Tax=Diaphorobacter sp. JS3051 TaxID=2792224 RepID=UPI0018C960BF|nr:hypothetical protein [Diaphorobacter sp. JS3051]QPN32911.1 hypothetical protein I3K84_10245 [Diaphorobacter sp. JS3051]
MTYFTTGAQLQAALNALPNTKTGNFVAFDSFFYGQQYMADYQGTLSPIEHFVQIGAARGYKPNATFDPTYYANAFADLKGKGFDSADLLYHFMQYGLDEGRAPNAALATFNGAAYLTAYPDVAAYVNANLAQFGGSATNGALAHYVKFGAAEGRTAPGTSVSNGQTFTLTTATGEIVNGTLANDTFNAVVAEDAGFPTLVTSSTLNAFDQVTGGEGVDTLNLVVQDFGGLTGDVSTLQGTVQGVEIINVDQTNGFLANGTDGTLAAGAFAGAEQIWQINRANSISGLAEGQTAGFRNIASIAATVGFVASADNAAIAFESSTVIDADDATEFDGQHTVTLTGAGLDTVTVSGSLTTVEAADELGGVFGLDYDDVAFLDLDIGGAGGASGVETLNINLSTNTILGVDEGFNDIETIDASGSTGGLVAVLAGSEDEIELSSVTGGSGDDVILTCTARYTNDVAIDAGAGDDVIQVQAQESSEDDAVAVTLAGGEGADLFAISGGNLVIATEDEVVPIVGDSIHITDFDAADTLFLQGFYGFTAQTLINNAVNGAETLEEAVAAVAEITGGAGPGSNITNFAQFEFDGATYVYGDTSEEAGYEGDLLVQVTGVELTNDNVVGTSFDMLLY